MKNNIQNKRLTVVKSIEREFDGIEILRPVLKEVVFDVKPKKRYYSKNLFNAMFSLSPCARNLLDYLTFNMNEKNYAFNDNLNRLSFISFCKNNTGIEYKQETVKQAFSNLTKSGILIRSDVRGVLYVNPEYFFNGNEAQRIRLIKLINQKEYLKTINP